MLFWLKCLLATVVLTFSTVTSDAQAPEQNQVGYDPPDREYTSGANATDPDIERSLEIAEHHRAFLPLAVDLSSSMPAVGDQGGLGSCTAWSTAYAARSYYTGAIERRDLSLPENLPSPNYIFHVGRRGKCDGGTNFEEIANVLKRGALSLADYPYSDKCVDPPPRQMTSRAHDFHVRGLRRIDTSKTDDVKGQLARSNPVLIRFHDSTAFHKIRGSATFTEATPPNDDKISGYHAMALVGYDERRQAFRLINSWGPGWGDKGYAWIGYNLLKSRITHAYTLDVGPLRPVVKVNPAPTPVKPPAVEVKMFPPPSPTVVTHVPPPTPPSPEKIRPVPSTHTHPGVALVIGNVAYVGATVTTASADAGLMAEVLRADGFSVTELHNVKLADIGLVLRNFLDEVATAGPDAVAVFYYAGHAAQFRGKNYLVPTDAVISGLDDVPLQALPLDDLVAELGKLPAAARIIVLDAVHDHGYGRGTPNVVPPGLTNVVAPPGFMIAFPATPGQSSEERSGEHSLYAATLARLMKERGLDANSVFNNLKEQVRQASQNRETPWSASTLPAGISLAVSSLIAQPVVTPTPSRPVEVKSAPPVPDTQLGLADLAKLQCANVIVQKRDRESILSGYVASEDDLNIIKAIAANVGGASLGDIIVAPWPQCEALQTLGKQLAQTDHASIDIGPQSEFYAGDTLAIQIQSPSQISYLYISYIQADGTVVNLEQPRGLVPQPTMPNSVIAFGDGRDGRAKFTVSPPFGKELIIALASRSPLFDEPLPVQQTEREYLSALRKALVYKPSEDMPDRELSATIKALQTRAR